MKKLLLAIALISVAGFATAEAWTRRGKCSSGRCERSTGCTRGACKTGCRTKCAECPVCPPRVEKLAPKEICVQEEYCIPVQTYKVVPAVGYEKVSCVRRCKEECCLTRKPCTNEEAQALSDISQAPSEVQAAAEKAAPHAMHETATK